MRIRPTGLLLLPLVVSLAACAPIALGDPGSAEPRSAASAALAPDAASAARAQAQAWLDAVQMPEGTERATYATAGFRSYQGWVCQPVEQLEGFWTVPGATVVDTANWLIAHPPADLVSTSPAPIPDTPGMDVVNLGFTPADGSYQGVVLSVATRDGGVGVRAQVAAMTAEAVCPTPPGGGQWGPPGMG